METNEKVCSKRVIIHAGVDLSIGVAVALAFDQEYVQRKEIKTGIFHSRTYTAGANETPYQVHHTKTSIIVTEGEPHKEPQVAGASSDKPKEAGVPA